MPRGTEQGADGETVETVRDFIFLGSKITEDGDCSKATTNLDSILKSRDITLPTKVRLAKVMVFPIVMYGCESWTVKKAERQRIDAFELWCSRRLLKVPWTARRSPWVGPGKPNLPLGLRGKAGGCARVTAGLVAEQAFL